MGQPLVLSYAWQPPALVATAVAALCVAGVARSDAPGRAAVVAVVVALWALVVALIWTRSRAYLRVDGSRLTVRRVRRMHTVDASQLVRVRQFLTRRGPSYRLVVRDADGREHSFVAPVALLRTGHSTLFGWILARAPQAELDRGSARTLDQLKVRGLVG
ncbi:hypothetical protein [uncultured Friedmanniella sp.]|uniref:hypothetical protein n=1 Tax=uncultured Friedmanniella sp. TaxID=335381 RepID=UPI0035CBDC4F